MLAGQRMEGGQLAPGSPWAPLAGRFETLYIAAAALTVAAGTSEIQRNIIAGRGLGPPPGSGRTANAGALPHRPEPAGAAA